MAKKKAKNKPLSARALKIHYKVVYQTRKLSKIKKELELLNDIPSAYKAPKTRLKLEATREIDGYVKKGTKRKFKTIQNALLNEGVKIQNDLHELKLKLSKHKKVRLEKASERDAPRRGEVDRTTIGRAWDNKEIEQTIYKGDLVSVNGFNIKKDKDKVDSILNSFKLKMNSDSLLVIHIDENGNARLALTNTEDNEIYDDSEL